MKAYKRIFQSLFLASLLTCGACTDLTDTVYSEITEDAFSKDPNSISLLIGNVYTSVGKWAAATNPNSTPFYYNVSTTDEMMIPFRNVTKEWNNANGTICISIVGVPRRRIWTRTGTNASALSLVPIWRLTRY